MAGTVVPAPPADPPEVYAPREPFDPDPCAVPGPYDLPGRVTGLALLEDGSRSMEHAQDRQGTFFPGLTRRAVAKYGDQARKRIFVAKYHLSGDVYYHRHLPLGRCAPLDYPKNRTTPVSKALRAIRAEGERFITQEVFAAERDFTYDAVLVGDWHPTGPGETAAEVDRAVEEFLAFVKTYGVKVTVVGDTPERTNLGLANRLNVTPGREVLFLDRADPEAVLNIVFATLDAALEE
ncbi:MAG: hypothetical protein K2X87_11060 [Gemmataceae bacterium]|nr:hypothetical protein [Gemmataceae bacterium]